MSNGEIRAAGGVVWRTGDAEVVEIALVHRPRYDDWSLPKGKLVAGESELAAALREVNEETGASVAHLGPSLGEIRYLKESNGVETPKTVRFWAMQAGAVNFSANPEVDEMRWLPLEEASALLTNATDRLVVRRFTRLPSSSALVVLVRHASAGSRSKWKGEDRLRVLDREGHAQAEALMPLLGLLGVASLVAADFVRCVQTLEPYAEDAGIPIAEEAVFSEDGYPGSETKAVDLLRALTEAEGAAAVCSQGDVIPDLIQRLSQEDGIAIEPPLEYKKGSAWALYFSARRLVGADYFPV